MGTWTKRTPASTSRRAAVLAREGLGRVELVVDAVPLAQGRGLVRDVSQLGHGHLHPVGELVVGDRRVDAAVSLAAEPVQAVEQGAAAEAALGAGVGAPGVGHRLALRPEHGALERGVQNPEP